MKKDESRNAELLADALNTNYTEFSGEVHDLISEDWEKHDAQDEMQKVLSSHAPGICSVSFGDWQEATAFVGEEPWDPFENEKWLSETEKYRIEAGQKNGTETFYRTEFAGDRNGDLKGITLWSDYPQEAGNITLIMNLYSESPAHAWPAEEEGDVSQLSFEVGSEENKRTIRAEAMIVHSDYYDAVRIAFPESSDFKYFVNVTSHKGTGELAKLLEKTGEAIGLKMDYDTLEKTASADEQ